MLKWYNTAVYKMNTEDWKIDNTTEKLLLKFLMFFQFPQKFYLAPSKWKGCLPFLIQPRDV